MLTPPQRLPPLRRMKALGQWLNDLRDYAASLNPMPSANVKVRHTALGTSYEADPGVATKGSTGMVFRGEWDGTLSYKEQDVVVIRGGVAAGTYVCVRDAPATTPMPTYPATGDFWVNLSPGNTLGAWA